MKAKSLLAAAAVVGVPSVAVAIPNPASVFCTEMGGRSVLAKLPSGDEIGLCYLTKRKIIEEWTLYRMLEGKRPAADKNPFR
ncbi:DUF333 domain-containing protein [Hansschlegelia plantiphila]|uniref:DUF333 domain-containing protein n=1 Tax=Hansschlegelia plantiphila TaxID=374655 RepID=A0A9W6MTX6_9HYPH|nr:DUF333 domain-containing protein [Hansschlegelia plantiphila]GLK66372.1 hypothetical protein GCM10008179_00100 [Hansschlegelia plantiphila]